MKSKETFIKFTIIISLTILLTLSIFLLLKGWYYGYFSSVNALRSYIASYGIWAPLFLTLIQLLLAIFPICPSFTGCIVGAALFGSVGGFWTNYIGISVGSIAAYILAKCFGIELVNHLLPLQKYESYIKKSTKVKVIQNFCFLPFYSLWHQTTFFAIFRDSSICPHKNLLQLSSWQNLGVFFFIVYFFHILYR